MHILSFSHTFYYLNSLDFDVNSIYRIIIKLKVHFLSIRITNSIIVKYVLEN